MSKGEHTPEEVARIAGSLTKAQREAVLNRSGTHEVITSPEVDPLWYAITKLGDGQFSIALRSIGHAVRTHLEQNHES